MKLMIYVSVLVFLSLSQVASAMNCFGIQATKGAKGSLVSTDSGEVSFSYVDNSSIKRVCVIGFDSAYKPRSSSPQKDRYLVDRNNSQNCGAEVVWISKSLRSAEGRGFVDVQFPCVGGGGCAHGEPGPIDSFVCSN